MTVAPTISGLRCLLRLIAVALAPAIVLFASGADATAAPTRPNHHCPCETKCRGASCCCPDDAPAPEANELPERVKASPSDASDPARPCYGSVPCGGGEAPSAPPGTSLPKAAIAAICLLDAPRPGDSLAAATGLHPPATTPERLDEPPERAG